MVDPPPTDGTTALIGRVSGELRDDALEDAFLDDEAAAQHRVWFGVAVGIAVAFLAFTVVDLASLGPGRTWALLLVARTAAAAATLLTGWALDRHPGLLVRTGGRVLLVGTQLVLAAVALAASASRPADALTNAFSLAVFALACMVMVPGRFRDQTAVGAVVCAGLVVVSVTRFEDPALPTLPLVANLVGVLLLGGTVRGLMNRDQRRQWIAVRRLGEQLARDRRLRSELQRLAREDPLTGAANRREFFDTLDGLVADRRATPSLAVLDLDRFKSVNDRFGHPAGDAVLVGVVAALRAAVRDDDLVARIGGEEFAVCMVGRDLDGAAAAAERIRRAVVDAEVPDGVAGPMTASVGVAIQRPGETVRELVARADDALYRAKRSGGNAVAIARAAPPEGRHRPPSTTGPARAADQ